MRFVHTYLFYILLSLMTLSSLSVASSDDLSHSEYQQNSWYQQGDHWLKQRILALQAQREISSENKAKNVILFVGDGMSITTLTAARIWQGQQAGKLGEEHFLHFEHYPHTALIKTYNTNQQSPDSAGTMTAMMTGVKTRAGLISIGPEQDRTECGDSERYHQKTLLEWGNERGYSTGVVTTARLTHATPAATYAHSPDRGWESDLLRHPNAYWHGCDSIAKQLVEKAFPAGLDIALGGGGSRLDNYYDSFRQQFKTGSLIHDQASLLSLTLDSEDKALGPVLGVFSSGHMKFELDRIKTNHSKPSALKQPSLKEMSEQALKYLQSKNENYLLVVEGARIDQAHHKGNAARALAETAMLADTVQRLDELTSDDDTLIIVTADHSHNFVMAGYPKRGNPILGVSKNQQNEQVIANDGLPYTTLGYANGKAAGRQTTAEQVPTEKAVNTEATDFHQGVTTHLSSATHGSDDVALHAKGPGAYLFSGLMEQHEIFHTIMQALQNENQADKDNSLGSKAL